MTAHPKFHQAISLFDPDDLPQIASNTPRFPRRIASQAKRLQHRFMDSGPSSVDDAELLELILTRAGQFHNVKPLVNRLFNVFGDFNRIVSAPINQLLDVKGVNDDVALHLKLVEASSHRLARSKIIERPLISSWDAVVDYCHTTMSHNTTEQFRVLFLDKKNVLIADEILGEGTVDHVPVYPREIVKRALELNATALILVHNHPSGDPTPSDHDIGLTHKIHTAVTALNITLHDHLIVGRSSEFSFRANGII